MTKRTSRKKDFLKSLSNVQIGSYNHLALNVFQSIYPNGFENKEKVDEYSSSESQAAIALNLLRNQIWKIVKSYSDQNKYSVKELNSMVLDPNNELGQEILKKINGNAKVVGVNGKEAFSFTKELYDPQFIKKVDFLPDTLVNSSENVHENNDALTDFIIRVINETNKVGLVKTINFKRGRLSSIEYIYSQCVGTVLNGIAYNISESIHRAFIEYEIIKNEEDIDFEKEVNTYVTKYLKSIGINLLPKTKKRIINEWIDNVYKNIDQFIDMDLALVHYIEQYKKEDNEIFIHSENVLSSITASQAEIENSLIDCREVIEIVMNDLISKDAIEYHIDEIDSYVKPSFSKKKNTPIEML